MAYILNRSRRYSDIILNIITGRIKVITPISRLSGVASFNVDIHSSTLTMSPIGVMTLLNNHSANGMKPSAPSTRNAIKSQSSRVKATYIRVRIPFDKYLGK